MALSLALALALALALGVPAEARNRAGDSIAPRVPSIEDVVTAEGFTPTPSQTEMYRPGAVLVPNGRGSHDVVVDDCIGLDPTIAIMSQSSIATTLSTGVSTRLAAVRGEVHADVEKRLSFVDPEQRTISLGRLEPTADCQAQVSRASALQDLSEAVVIHDVLVAIIQNTVCTRADASGSVVALGAAEAAAYSECVQESDAQVPLGYKSIPLAKLMQLGPSSAARPAAASAPAAVRTSLDFGRVQGGLGVDEKLRQQACDRTAEAEGKVRRDRKLDAASADAQGQATAAWKRMEGDVTACVQLELTERAPCVEAVEGWLRVAEDMSLELPAGVETIETDCGAREVAFSAARRKVDATEVGAAKRLLSDLARSPATKRTFTVLDGEFGSAGTASTSAPGNARSAGHVRVGGDPIILGALDKRLIDQEIAKHLPAIGRCFDAGSGSSAERSGKVVVKFVIANTGSVSKSTVKTTTVADSAVSECAAAAFGGMHFAEPKGGGIVITMYPFIFSQ